MPLTTQSPINNYVGNGSTTVFAYTYKILVASDLKVYKDGVLQTYGYTVGGVGVDGGGSVTFSPAPGAGVIVRLQRIVPLDRTTDYTEGGQLAANTLDNDFDRAIMQLQDLDALVIKEASDGAIDAGSRRIKNIADPTGAQDAVTKIYVDGIASTAVASASASAATATTQAGIATTQAGIATTKAGEAAASATAIASGTQTVTNLVATGGTLDNVAIGSTTRSTVKGTSGDFNLGLSTTGTALAGRTLTVAYDGTYYWTLVQQGAGGVAYRSMGGAGNHDFETGSGGNIQARVLHTASATRYLTLTGSAGGNPTISTSAGNLAITPSVVVGSYAANNQYGALLGARTAGPSYEWGHHNTAGYGSVIGANSGSGNPYIAFNSGPGTTSNTFRTYGIIGAVISSTMTGGISFSSVDTATGDNQTLSEQVRVVGTAGATRYVTLTGSAGGNPTIGTSAGILNLAPNGYVGMQVDAPASCVNYITISGSATGNNVVIRPNSLTDTNVGLTLDSKGTGSIQFRTDPYGTPANQCIVLHTASANRYITLTGSNGGNPTISTSAGSLAITTTVAQTTTVGGEFATFESSAASVESAVRINSTQATSGIALKLSNSGNNVQSAMRLSGVGNIDFYNGQTPGAASTTGNINLRITNVATANQYINIVADTSNGPRITCAGNADANLYLSSGAGTGSVYLYTNNIGSCAVRIDHVASANRYITMAGSNSQQPKINTSAGALLLGAAGSDVVALVSVASAVNLIQLQSGGTGTPAYVYPSGVSSDTNVDLVVGSKGTGAVRLLTNGALVEQVRIVDTATANRYITLTGSNGGNPIIGTSGGNLQVNPSLVCLNTLWTNSSTAIPAGGAQYTGFYATSTSHFGVFFGSGAPTVSAAAGSIYLRSDGASYINTNGTTGWVPNRLDGYVTNAAATYSWTSFNSTVVQTTAASTHTLPTASTNTGRTIRVVTQFAGAVISNASNVIPLAGGSAGTAILAATAGKWADLISNGTNWVIVAAN